MKIRMLALVSALCVLLAWALPAAANGTAAVRISGVMRYDYGHAVFLAVNEARETQGLPVLTESGKLTAMAMHRAAELSLHYAHTRPNGKDWSSINGSVIEGERMSYAWSRWGENIAMGYQSARSVMEGWMDSDGHRANILNPHYTQIGVGCFETDGRLYWVQIFGNGNDPTRPAQTGAAQVQVMVEVCQDVMDR